DSAVRQGLLSSLCEKPMRYFAFLGACAGVWLGLGLAAAITPMALSGSSALAAAAALRPSPAAPRRKSKRLILPARSSAASLSRSRMAIIPHLLQVSVRRARCPRHAT